MNLGLFKREELGLGDKDHPAVLFGRAGAAIRGVAKERINPCNFSLRDRGEMFSCTAILPLVKPDLPLLDDKETVRSMPFVKKDLPFAKVERLPFS
jgi:hypothetical protein